MNKEQEQLLQELKARLEAQSRKIRMLEKEIQALKKHISQRKLIKYIP